MIAFACRQMSFAHLVMHYQNTSLIEECFKRFIILTFYNRKNFLQRCRR